MPHLDLVDLPLVLSRLANGATFLVVALRHVYAGVMCGYRDLVFHVNAL